jgi:hypothetical protein
MLIPVSICAFVIGLREGKRSGAMERAASGVRAASEAMLIEELTVWMGRVGQ